MGLQDFAASPKPLVKGEDIGPGQIDLRHLSPALYTEIRKVGLHAHSGQGSRRVNVSVLEGAFNFYYMKSSDGGIWKITITNAGALEVTAM